MALALTRNQEQLLNLLKQVALELGENGRALTSLIGELSACKLLDLSWRPSPGYDALAPDRRRFQIKARKSWSTDEVNPHGRLGKFGKKGKYDFDHGLFVELNKDFEVRRIWQLARDAIVDLETGESGGRGLHVGTFMRSATLIYCRDAR